MIKGSRESETGCFAVIDLGSSSNIRKDGFRMREIESFIYFIQLRF